MISLRTFGAAVAAALAMSCGPSVEEPEELGGVKLVVSGAFLGADGAAAALPRPALSTATVTSVVLYATPLFEGGRSFVQPLTPDPATGRYEVEILHMKVGSYEFRADAANAEGTVLFTATQVYAIQKKVIGFLALVLQQVPPPDTVSLTAPRIVALSLSTAAPYFGEAITIAVTAVSGSPGATLTYGWEATCAGDPAATSVFSPPDVPTTLFSTSCSETAVVTVHVSEGASLRSSLTTRIRYTTQGVDAVVTLNSWPDVTGIGSTSAQAVAGGTIPVFATAKDDDGDALTYAWSSSCGGSFVAGNTLAATFHAPVMPDGGCTLTFTVRDARGGTNSGTVEVWIATPTLINEILYDPAGIDFDPGNTLFVELWGVPGQSLAGFTLAHVNGFDGADLVNIDLSAGVIGADGYFLVAHPNGAPALTAIADLLAHIDFQNAPDSVQLRRDGVVVDAVAYGLFSATNFIAGEGRPAPDAFGGASLTRDDAHADTGDNLSDFTVAASPTPRGLPL